jgi:hypothetical protein
MPVIWYFFFLSNKCSYTNLLNAQFHKSSLTCGRKFDKPLLTKIDENEKVLNLFFDVPVALVGFASIGSKAEWTQPIYCPK